MPQKVSFAAYFFRPFSICQNVLQNCILSFMRMQRNLHWFAMMGLLEGIIYGNTYLLFQILIFLLIIISIDGPFFQYTFITLIKLERQRMMKTRTNGYFTNKVEDGVMMT